MPFAIPKAVCRIPNEQHKQATRGPVVGPSRRRCRTYVMETWHASLLCTQTQPPTT